jgi:pimeloyl-ACP methyl ester carboxylesterase
MGKWKMVVLTVASVLLGGMVAISAPQAPAVRSLDEQVLREYAGVYQWQKDAFLYLQLWGEFSGKNQLVAFDESGEVRTLYPTDGGRFFAGPGAAVPTSIESQIEFQRDGRGKITSLTWKRDGTDPRTAQRVEFEKREDVRFPSGSIQLAGTLISPATGGKHPAIILVHGSGAQNRESMLPFARFLIRRGLAVLGYDKRGVEGSTGDWKTASFEELAGDVVAAFDYLKTRSDIDRAHIGLMGISQAGWIMPLAAIRARDIAFLISISGAGVPAAETTIDHAQREMTASGMPPGTVADIVELLRLQYEFARTGEGWDKYDAAREKLAARMGPPPDTFPGSPDHPQFEVIRRSYLYDPAPTLRQLQTPVLALFGELDNNILAEKNKTAWEAALIAGRHHDYTLQILAKANHGMFEAKVGNNKEMASLRRFVPAYFTAIQDWLAKRIRLRSARSVGFPAATRSRSRALHKNSGVLRIRHRSAERTSFSTSQELFTGARKHPELCLKSVCGRSAAFTPILPLITAFSTSDIDCYGARAL